MEAVCSSETSVELKRTTRRYIPEDSALQVSTHQRLPVMCMCSYEGKYAEIYVCTSVASNTHVEIYVWTTSRYAFLYKAGSSVKFS
jgi:hypothetical protein